MVGLISTTMKQNSRLGRSRTNLRTRQRYFTCSAVSHLYSTIFRKQHYFVCCQWAILLYFSLALRTHCLTEVGLAETTLKGRYKNCCNNNIYFCCLLLTCTEYS